MEPKPDIGSVTIDFEDVDIKVFIKFISEITGKNFVIDNAVRGNVTIVSPTKITLDEAYKVFESVLEVHGFATVPAGSIIKIIPASDARTKDIETRLRKEAITPDDKIVTQLIPLRYADPDEIKKLFSPMISKSSVMVSYPPTGMLIVTDVLSNIKRLLSIIDTIDIEGIGEELSVVPLSHASASVMGKSLSTIFQTPTTRTTRGATVNTSQIKIIPDERTNSLILLASETDTIKIKQLIILLDKEVPKGEGDIRVYYLQNANAEDLSKVLMAIPKEQKTETEKGKAPVISKEVQIVADKSTNSLIITANRDDYLVLEDVIKKLDIPRRMVYIEALIMEVDVDKSFDLGVEWRAGDKIDDYQDGVIGAFGGSGGRGADGGYSNFPGVDTTGALTFPSGFSVGVIGAGIKIGDLFFPTLGAVLRAYQKDSDVNIISTPQILTTDNEEAQIVVAENVPYITKQETTSTTSLDYTTYEYKDVGVTLKITPQISQERFVRLKIFQEVINLKKGSEQFRPTTLKRSAETTVIVKDENTVVIGGIIQETDERGAYRVPCLGSMPILGWFFKSSSRSNTKTNLFIFLTPHIIENPEEAEEIYEKKQGYMDTVKEGVIKMYEGRGEKRTDDGEDEK
ncbi:MAG: type II secretion system secretin GspD [Deltaproteobacteria bacterium]|nr:type II secretion system secretin GspD [Deltaproteobacteria bacterium]